ncbi:MAG: leucine-rich repeat domain-containing protein [Aureispira sp.]|nr:leucine-rich repeat domain-containing protein [Aureispira sp.]
MESIEKILSLVYSGQPSNIHLGFKLAASQNIDLQPYFEWIRILWDLEDEVCEAHEICEMFEMKAFFGPASPIPKLPSEIGLLTKLEELELCSCSIENLCPELEKLTSLKILDLCENKLTEVSPEILALKQLESLVLFRNNIHHLTKEVGSLTNLVRLDVSENHLTSIPDVFEHMHKLEHAQFEKNKIEEVPLSLAKLPNLHFLNLEDNNIKRISDEFAKTLFAEGNSIIEISMYNNPIEYIPEILLANSLVLTGTS